MPIVNITTWPTPLEKKQKMMKEITQVIHETTGAPLTKITVIVQEIDKHDWSEAGITGDDPDFAKLTQKILPVT
jgi:4-oxalocrotonate tautomerase